MGGIADFSGLSNIKGKLNSVAFQFMNLMMPEMKKGHLACRTMESIWRPGLFTTLLEQNYVDLPGGVAMMEQVL